MSTATITRETEVISRARDILARTDADPEFPWVPDEACRTSIRACAEGIRESLEVHEDIRSGRLHPVSEFPDLGAGHPDDALATALERVTEDVGLWSGALVVAVREYAGDEMARRLGGEEGSRS